MKSFTFLFIITLLLAFSAVAQTPVIPKVNIAAIENKLCDEDEIREIVFKEILKSWNGKVNENIKTYYLSLDGKDISKNLLKRFADYKISIKNVSELGLLAENNELLSLDEALEGQGVMFSVSKLEWKNKDEVTLNAGSYLGNMGSNGCIYNLKRENGEWKIISAENCFVS